MTFRLWRCFYFAPSPKLLSFWCDQIDYIQDTWNYFGVSGRIFTYIYTITSIRIRKICIPTLIFKSIHHADLPMYVGCPPPSLITYSCRRCSNFFLPCSPFLLLETQSLKAAVNLSFSLRSVSFVKRLQPFIVVVVPLSYKICMICLCVWATS